MKPGVRLLIYSPLDRGSRAQVRDVLRRHGFSVQWNTIMEFILGEDDPRLAPLLKDLQDLGQRPSREYVSVFEPGEVERAELLTLTIGTECGPGFGRWVKDLNLPSGTLVMDKREMGGADITITHAFEAIISERLRGILVSEGLTGWRGEAVQHVDPAKDGFGKLYFLTATNQLPALAPQTKIHAETHENVPKDNPLYGTVGLFQRSPLYYRRQDLHRVEDLNHTRELFGEVVMAQPYFILSQRAWKVLVKHKIEGTQGEPIVLVD